MAEKGSVNSFPMASAGVTDNKGNSNFLFIINVGLLINSNV